MKTLLLFVLAFIWPVFAFATSGACSHHGGVSCSQGPDSDGSVICGDGWRNSSVSYASMTMCQGYSAPAQKKVTPVLVPVAKTSVIKTAVGPITINVQSASTTKVAPARSVIAATSTTTVTEQKPATPVSVKKRGFFSRLAEFF